MGNVFPSMHERSLNTIVYSSLAISSAIFIYYSIRLKKTNQEFLQKINSTLNTVKQIELAESIKEPEEFPNVNICPPSECDSVNNEFSVDKEWDEFFTMERVNVPIYVALYMRAKCMEFIKVLQGKTFCSIMVDPVKTTSYHDFFYEQQPIIITGNKRYYKRAVQELNQLVGEVRYEVFIVKRGVLKKLEYDGKRSIISKINRSTNTLLVTYLLDDTFNADYGEDVRVVLLGREQAKFVEARDKIKKLFDEMSSAVNDLSELNFGSEIKSSFTLNFSENSASERSRVVSSPAIDMYNKFMDASLIKSVQSVQSVHKMGTVEYESNNEALKKALSSEEKIIADSKHKTKSSLMHLYSLNENLNEDEDEDEEEEKVSPDKKLKSKIFSRFKSKKDR